MRTMARNTGWGSGIPVTTVPQFQIAKTSFVGWFPHPIQDRCRCTGRCQISTRCQSDVVIFEGVDSNGNPDPDGRQRQGAQGRGGHSCNGNTSYYAYWVEDEGVKAIWPGVRVVLPMLGANRRHVSQLHQVWITGFLVGPLPVGVSYPLERGVVPMLD